MRQLKMKMGPAAFESFFKPFLWLYAVQLASGVCGCKAVGIECIPSVNRALGLISLLQKQRGVPYNWRQRQEDQNFKIFGYIAKFYTSLRYMRPCLTKIKPETGFCSHKDPYLKSKRKFPLSLPSVPPSHPSLLPSHPSLPPSHPSLPPSGFFETEFLYVAFSLSWNSPYRLDWAWNHRDHLLLPWVLRL